MPVAKKYLHFRLLKFFLQKMKFRILFLTQLLILFPCATALKASDCHPPFQVYRDTYFPMAKKAVINVMKYCEWHANHGQNYGQCLDHFGIRRGISLAMIQNDQICLTKVVPFASAGKVCMQGNQGDRNKHCFRYWSSP